MMIEPPGQLVRGAVLEIDNDILAIAEEILADALAGLVGQAFVFDLCAWCDLPAIEARKHRRGSEPIEAIVVIENSQLSS